MTKTILITGCSSGIGMDAAKTLHAMGGWRVFAACRKQADCDAMRNDHGLETCLIDYSKPATIASGLAHVLSETGGTLDALFNNGAYGMGCAAEARVSPCVFNNEDRHLIFKSQISSYI